MSVKELILLNIYLFLKKNVEWEESRSITVEKNLH